MVFSLLCLSFLPLFWLVSVGSVYAQTPEPPTPTPTYEPLFKTSTPQPTINTACPTGTPVGWGTVTPSADWSNQCSACKPLPVWPTSTALPCYCGTPSVLNPTPNPALCSCLSSLLTGTPAPTITPTITPTPGIQAFEWNITTPAYHLANPLGSYAVPETAYFGYWPTCPSGSNVVGINIDIDLWAGTYSGYPTVSYLNQADNKDYQYYYYSAANKKHSLQAYRYEGFYSAPAGYTAIKYSTYSQTNFNGDNFIVRIFNSSARDMHATINRLSTLCYGVPPAPTPTPASTQQSGYCAVVNGNGQNQAPLDLGWELPSPYVGPSTCWSFGNWTIGLSWISSLGELVDVEVPDSVSLPGWNICAKPIYFGHLQLFDMSVDLDVLASAVAAIALLMWVRR